MSWFFWALLSAAFAGITAVLAKIGVADINSHLATAIRTAVILVFSWAVALSVVSPAEVSRISNRTWLFLVLSGIATGLSWLCYFRALQLGEASRVAPVDKLSVVFAIVLAIVLWGYVRVTVGGVNQKVMSQLVLQVPLETRGSGSKSSPPAWATGRRRCRQPR